MLSTIALTTGGASAIGLIALAATTDSGDDWGDFSAARQTAVIGSFVGLLGGAITAIVAQNKRKKSIYTFNDDCNCIVQAPNSEYKNLRYWSVGPTNSGMGFAYNF